METAYRGKTCLSQRRVVFSADVIEHRRLPEAKRRDPDGGSPFFPLGFFGETKKGNSPAGARPGLYVKGNTLKPKNSSPLINRRFPQTHLIPLIRRIRPGQRIKK